MMPPVVVSCMRLSLLSTVVVPKDAGAHVSTGDDFHVDWRGSGTELRAESVSARRMNDFRAVFSSVDA